MKNNKALQNELIRQDIINNIDEARALGYSMSSILDSLKNDVDIDPDILNDIIAEIEEV